MKPNEAKSKFIYPDKLYARTKDNKTLDISYAPQTLEAVEYTRTDAFEVDLQKEIESYFKGFGKFASVGIDDCIDIAKHFFQLGLKTQKGK